MRGSGSYVDHPGNIWGLGGRDDQHRLEVTTRFIRKHIHDPRVLIECGPLHGAITVLLLEAFSGAELHLVEHEPTATSVLRERFGGEARVKVHEADMLALPSLPVPPADGVLLIESLYYLDQGGRVAFVKGLQRSNPRATVIVSTPVQGGYYFTQSELRRLFAGYRLTGVDVMNRRNLRRATRGVLRGVELLKLDAVLAPLMSSYITSEANREWPTHGIFSFTPRPQ